jgi:hypothetical protein
LPVYGLLQSALRCSAKAGQCTAEIVPEPAEGLVHLRGRRGGGSKATGADAMIEERPGDHGRADDPDAQDTQRGAGERLARTGWKAADASARGLRGGPPSLLGQGRQVRRRSHGHRVEHGTQVVEVDQHLLAPGAPLDVLVDPRRVLLRHARSDVAAEALDCRLALLGSIGGHLGMEVPLAEAGACPEGELSQTVVRDAEDGADLVRIEPLDVGQPQH